MDVSVSLPAKMAIVSLDKSRGDVELLQQVLGDKLGVSRQTVIAIERGRYDPSLPLAFEMARVFGLAIEEVFRYRPSRRVRR